MKELIYEIDTHLSGEDKALAIKIQPAERFEFVYQPITTDQPLTKEKLKALSSPKDAALIQFLIKEELSFIKKKTGRNFEDPKTTFNLVHIAFSEVPEAFRLFSMNGKLHYNGKSIVIDLYGKSSFYYIVETIQGITRAQGYINTGSLEFPIKACDYVGRGSPHWFIKGPSLKLITTDISWSDLNASFHNQERPYSELIKESKEDEEAPLVIVKGDVTIPINDPFPILVLKDRQGAFADLSILYSDENGKALQQIDFQDPRSNIESMGKVICKRKIKEEQALEKDLLETGYVKKNQGTSHYYCPLDKVAKSIAFLIEIGWQVTDSKSNKVYLYKDSELFAEKTLKGIALKGKVQFDEFKADVVDIVGAFNRRERFVEIAPFAIALLPNSLEEISLNDLAECGEIIGKEIHIKNTQIGASLSLFEKQPKIILDPSISRLKEKLSTFQCVEESLPSMSFNGTLRPYQQTGLNWLSFLYEYQLNGLLADDMGLGKTVQVIAFLSRIQETSRPILIVMPTSLIFNWKRELEKFLPNADVIIHQGKDRNATFNKLTGSCHHIILTTYATARIDANFFAKIPFECLILDEAQAIKNASTQTAKALSQFSSAFKLSITGTPVENNIMELWSHFHFLIPDLFGDETSFQAEVQAGMSDSRYIKRIKKMIKPFLLRRRKEEVAKDLPEKIEQVVYITMEDKQRAIYEEFLSGIKKNLITKVNAEGTEKHRMEILEAIMRLRQICCHPLLVSQGEVDPVSLESAKLEALMEDLETAIQEGRKVLVYSQFTSMLGIIAKKLKEKHVSFAYLDGSTKNREEVVESFQNDPELKIFLLSLKAGGVGLNLTAADYVFLYDPWWNAAVENQAIDRAHRIGRIDTVIAKRYIIAESIEEKMMLLKSAKTNLAKDLLNEEGTETGALSTEDLLYLLS